MQAIRFSGDKTTHLTSKDGGNGTLCGWHKWDVAERWPAELGVPTAKLCRECRDEAEANAQGRSIYVQRPRARPQGFVASYQAMCKKYGLDPKDPLGIL